jgi:hypothetical protein
LLLIFYSARNFTISVYYFVRFFVLVISYGLLSNFLSQSVIREMLGKAFQLINLNFLALSNYSSLVSWRTASFQTCLELY